MSVDQKKTIIVFAGANGAGKTTAAQFLLPNHWIRQFVNADEIARGLSPFAPETQQIEAGRLLLKRVRGLIEARESFAYETTLSGRTQLTWLKQAKANGYKIILYYICTDNVDINLNRIAQRVRQGGHNVSEADVRRRYDRSPQNLFHEYGPICDMIEIYDNSQETLALVAQKSGLNGNYHILDMALWEKINR